MMRNSSDKRSGPSHRIVRPGVNFSNVLQAAFTRADPKSEKKQLNVTVFFALLGSAGVKAARRTLVKLTPGVVFQNNFLIHHVII